MKKIVIALLFSLFLIACGDSVELAWVNPLDPHYDAEKLAEICGDFECGTVEYQGEALLCGECAVDQYCSASRQCEKKCSDNACSTHNVITYDGSKSVECGECKADSVCTHEHTCLKNEAICYRKSCGKASYQDKDNKTKVVDCGSCDADKICDISQNCTTEAILCEERCGDVTVQGYEKNYALECGTCEGAFGYCNTSNVCATACDGKTCDTEDVTIAGGDTKSFTCGVCSGEKSYCSNTYACKTACAGKECGSEVINTVDGDETMECGTCLAPSYCDSGLSCKTGTQKDDYIYDENIVVDTTTSLMWQRGNQATITFDNAAVFCDDSMIDDFNDWRLPSISELRSIVGGCDAVGTGFDTVTGDDATTCGVIDACVDSTCSDAQCAGCTNSAGPGEEGVYMTPEIWLYTADANGRFWSSSTVPDQADSVWFIRFSNASVAYNWNGSEYFVKCVRDAD